jgi:hypothetical protein
VLGAEVMVGTGALVVMWKYEEGHDPGWTGLQSPGMLETEMGVAAGLALVVSK